MKEPLVKTEHLRVIYNQGKSNEVRSLEDVSVEIYPQEYVIIHGPSGCGKSTLLYSIAGLQMPTYGEVFIEGKKLSQMKPKEKVKLHQTGIGMIFQAFYLIPSLNVIDNVCLPQTFLGVNSKTRREEGIMLLRRFGIAEQANKLPSQLSGGQKQRVAIARSLINNPQIILADEPVGNLDSESAQNVLQILKELNNIDKKTIVLVTHNPEHLHYADRVISMKDGRVISEEVIKEKRPESVVKKELSSEPLEISNELRLLSRTFKSLTAAQTGVLLIPFKAKQMLVHILSELTNEQLDGAENILKELLFKNINIPEMEKNLDMAFEEGGAGWNKLRVKSFSRRVREIMDQAEIIKSNPEAAIAVSDYLINLFNLNLDEKMKLRFQSSIKMRIENKIDQFNLKQRLDSPKVLGGIGLYKVTADKIVREIELLMLLKYSA